MQALRPRVLKSRSPQKRLPRTKGLKLPPSKEPATAAKPSTDGKVAVVNDTVIKKDMLDTEVVRFEKQMAMSGQAPDPAKTAEVQKKGSQRSDRSRGLESREPSIGCFDRRRRSGQADRRSEAKSSRVRRNSPPLWAR